MSAHMERAGLLIGQDRFTMAEAELRQHLGGEPDDAVAHALLGFCLSRQEKHDEAEREARQAIGLGPDHPLTHYFLGEVLVQRNRFDEAMAAAEEAIRLNPEDADLHSLKGSVHLCRRQWPEALEAADRGLALDPEHVGCNNLRAMALTQLGRKDEAGRTIGAALEREPENALAHANRGWAYLHEASPAKALEHFREALRLDPTCEYSRAGIVEALKARNMIYGLMLRWFLWMGRLSGKAQWAVIIGLFVGARLLRSVGRSNPGLEPFVWPILIVYNLFCFMTWFADPLFNLLLRLNPFGRLALSRDQIVASNWVGGALLGTVAGAAAWAITGQTLWGLAAGASLLMVMPIVGTFRCDKGWPRRSMAAVTVLIGGCGVAALVLALAARTEAELESAALPAILFAVGVFFSQWIANALAAVTPRR